VQDILDRANVGRSTFYMHFHDKEELLVSGFRDMLHSASAQRQSSGKDREEMFGFSLPLFEHVHEHRFDSHAGAGSAAWGIVHQHLRRAIAEMIADQVKSTSQRRTKSRVQIPADLLIQHVASTFILVLTWWASGKSRLTPKEADALFRALIPSV